MSYFDLPFRVSDIGPADVAEHAYCATHDEYWNAEAYENCPLCENGEVEEPCSR